MEKSIKIDSKTSLKLSNNAAWLMEYQTQFGQDILETLEPAIMALVGLFAPVYDLAKEQGVPAGDIIRSIDPDVLRDAIIDVSGLGAVDIINMIWAMAKAADEDIEEPRVWIKQFQIFPLDTIIPAAFMMAIQGLITTKKYKGLQETLRDLEPSPSTGS